MPDKHSDQVVISSFYHFLPIEDCADLREELLKFCQARALKGTILLANEGVNSTISGSRQAIDELYGFLRLRLHTDLNDWFIKENYAAFQPFLRMKVRIKKEIVTMGVTDLDIAAKGNYIEPKEWDEFIARQDVLVIDTRNNYEVALGKFSGATDPETRTFREFPSWVQSHLNELNSYKVAMYCTGGIRCEKSTSYLKQLGIKEVYHLKGGILQYLQDTGNINNKWQGDCFVFDDRVAVNTDLSPAAEISCPECHQLLTTDDLKGYKATPGKCLNCTEQQ